MTRQSIFQKTAAVVANASQAQINTGLAIQGAVNGVANNSQVKPFGRRIPGAITLVLDNSASSAAKSFVFVDSAGLISASLPGDQFDPTSVTNGVSVASLKERFNKLTVMVSSMALQVTDSANTFNTPLNYVRGEIDAQFDKTQINLAQAQNPEYLNQKLILVSFSNPLIMDQITGFEWNVPAGEKCLVTINFTGIL